MAEQRNTSSPFNYISGIIGLLLVFTLLFYFVKGIFAILFWVAPVLLVLTLIIDYTVVTDFGKWIYNMLTRNWVNSLYIIGILLALSFIGVNAFSGILFPAVASFLFGKALLKKKVKSVKEEFENRTQGEYVHYEEVKEEPVEKKNSVEDIEFEEVEEMELEDLDEVKPPKTKQKEIRGNEYDELFE